MAAGGLRGPPEPCRSSGGVPRGGSERSFLSEQWALSGEGHPATLGIEPSLGGGVEGARSGRFLRLLGLEDRLLGQRASNPEATQLEKHQTHRAKRAVGK